MAEAPAAKGAHTAFSPVHSLLVRRTSLPCPSKDAAAGSEHRRSLQSLLLHRQPVLPCTACDVPLSLPPSFHYLPRSYTLSSSCLESCISGRGRVMVSGVFHYKGNSELGERVHFITCLFFACLTPSLSQTSLCRGVIHVEIRYRQVFLSLSFKSRQRFIVRMELSDQLKGIPEKER